MATMISDMVATGWKGSCALTGVTEEPQRHKDTKKGRKKRLFDAAFLCVFVSLWFIITSRYLINLSLDQEPLHALSGIDLARVDVAFRVGGHHVKPVKTAAGVAEESEVAERLAVRAVYDPHDVIHDIRDVDEARVRSREGQAAGRPAIQGFGRDREFPHER